MNFEHREWRGCYSGNYDLWCPDAYSHPAKMSVALCFRILSHLEGLGLLNKGDTILDFMGGIGTTCLASGTLGYRSIMVELEPKFVDLVTGFDCDGVIPGYTQEWVDGEVRGWIVYSGAEGAEHVFDTQEEAQKYYDEEFEWKGIRDGLSDEQPGPYWQEGTEGYFKDVPLASRCGKREEHAAHHVIGNKEHVEKRLGRELDMTIIQGDARNLSTILSERGLVSVVSPPYSEALSGGGINVKGYMNTPHSSKSDPAGSRTYSPETHGTAPGQIGQLKDRPVAIVSPPYANRMDGGSTREGYVHIKPYDYDGKSEDYRKRWPTQRPAENIGNLMEGTKHREERETYLEAMRQVYTEASRCCSVLVVVLKDPTRNGKIRELGKDTWELMEQCGWTIVDYRQAILFEEHEQAHLFEGKQTKVKGRLSFFKRLAKQKGSPVSNFEHIIFAVSDKEVKG